jgi:predicted nucleic acid-binding protein
LLQAYAADGFTNLDAVRLIDTLTRLPTIRMLPEPPDIESLWHRLAGLNTASPKVWMDAYLAAFAIRHQADFITLDRDFLNFEKDGLRVNRLNS